MVFTVVPLLTDFADDLCDNIADQIKSGIADHAIFSMPLAPEGIPAIDKAKAFCEKYVILKEKLKERGVECGVLVQSTIGHSYFQNRQFPFQRFTKMTDGQIMGNPCPYDKDFQDYFRNALRTIAMQKPSIIMIDDDFRLLARPGRGCACPLHMKEINKRSGKEYTREELSECLKRKDEESTKLRQIYIETQRDALLQTAKAMREGIDSVDSSIQGSFCGCGSNIEFASEIGKILAGKGNPTIVRINNGNYCSYSTKGLSISSCRAATNIEFLKDVDIILAETDTCPQTRYSTNAMFLHSHYVLSILEGVKGAKHWITDMKSNEIKACNVYKKTLVKYNGFYKSLMDIVPSLKWLGCRIPLRTKPDYGFNAMASGAWYLNVLERLGLPLYFSAKSGGMVFLDEFDKRSFSDEEIKQFFKDGVILSVKAAQTLIDMGYSDYIGVSFRQWDGLVPEYEKLKRKGARCRLQKDMLEIVPESENVEIDSFVCNCVDGVNESILFPGSTIFENPLGGKTVVFAGTPRTDFTYTAAFSFLSTTRKDQFVDIMQNAGKLPVYYTEDEDIYFRAAEMPGNKLFCSIINLGVDPAEEISLYVDRKINSVQILMPNGNFEECEFSQKENSIVINTQAIIMQPVILILS